MKDGKYIQSSFSKKTMGVGDDMSATGSISAKKLQEIETVLKAWLEECRQAGVESTRAVATAAFREAKNKEEVMAIGKRIGLPIEIASEARESELAYWVGTLGETQQAVIDNGSRSIEFVTHDPKTGYQWKVYNLGYRVSFKKFFEGAKDFPSAKASMEKELRATLDSVSFMKEQKKYVGVEFSEVVDFSFQLDSEKTQVLTLKTLLSKCGEYEKMTAKEFSELKSKPNADRALPRLVVASFFAQKWGYSEMTVVERELGVGLLIERALRK